MDFLPTFFSRSFGETNDIISQSSLKTSLQDHGHPGATEQQRIKDDTNILDLLLSMT